MAKTNYNQAKRQKENARKARQQEKLAKKLARVTGDPETPEAPASGGDPGRAAHQGGAVRFTSANSRNQLRERQRRDRATAQVMRALYPQFASLKLEFDFSEPDPDASAPAPHLLVMHPPSQAYFVFPCPYADCDGEFDLGSVVAELARSKEPHTPRNAEVRRPAGPRQERAHALPAHARIHHRAGATGTVDPRARRGSGYSPMSSFHTSGFAAM